MTAKIKTHGGKREGAGRPKGSTKELLPLDYMLEVMRDESADAKRRDEMAKAAAPYVHARLDAKAAAGKKEQAEAAAQTAGKGSEWESDLQFIASMTTPSATAN